MKLEVVDVLSTRKLWSTTLHPGVERKEVKAQSRNIYRFDWLFTTNTNISVSNLEHRWITMILHQTGGNVTQNMLIFPHQAKSKTEGGGGCYQGVTWLHTVTMATVQKGFYTASCVILFNFFPSRITDKNTSQGIWFLFIAQQQP